MSCVSFYQAGQWNIRIGARILSQDSRSPAPADGYSTWLTIPGLDDVQLRGAKSSLRVAKELPELITQQRLSQLSVANLDKTCGQLFGHLVRTKNLFQPPLLTFDTGCDCGDLNRAASHGRWWCKHVAALCYVLINKCETEACQVMTELGFDIRDYLLKLWIDGEDEQDVIIIGTRHVGEQALVSTAAHESQSGTSKNPIQL